MSTERDDLVKRLMALANCEANEVADALNEAADRIAADEVLLEEAREACSEAEACFKAAYIEGLEQVLAETTDERLKDLFQRRIVYALEAVQKPLVALTQRLEKK